VQELVEQLESLCEKTGIEKFSAGEMVELLEDGEEIEWILDQIGQQAESPVGVLLQQIASEVAPEQSDVDDEEEVDGQEVEGDAGEDDFDPANLDMAELEGMLPPGVDMGQVQKMLLTARCATGRLRRILSGAWGGDGDGGGRNE